MKNRLLLGLILFIPVLLFGEGLTPSKDVLAEDVVAVQSAGFDSQPAQSAYTVRSVPNPHTNDINNFVSNPDGILSTSTVSQINQLLNELETETNSEVALVVLNSIGSDDIKDFAVKLFAEWGIGKALSDNGLLVLFVLDQRKITFEVGYGLEGILPDAICKRIQMEYMIPYFKDGDYDTGILMGIRQISSVLKEEPFEDVKNSTNWYNVFTSAIIFYLIIGLGLFIWISSIVNKVKKEPRFRANIDRYKSIKSKKNNALAMTILFAVVTGFVSIYFISGWAFFVFLSPIMFIPANIFAKRQMKKVRRASFPCPKCNGGKMKYISEKHEDDYLDKKQQLEEDLKSVDYDVFVCDRCHNEAIFPLDKPSKYSVCAKCGTKAYVQTRKSIVVAPTYISSGIESITYTCKFCGNSNIKNIKIPKLVRATSGGSGGSFGGGGSMGGGFGGGRSGGGGATSGW